MKTADPKREMARHMTEGQLLAAIVEAAEIYGWRIFHIRRSDKALQMGHAGFPDLCLAKSGRILFLELKREGGQLAPAQRDWIAAINGPFMANPQAYRYTVALLVRPADLDGIIGRLADR